MRSLLLASAVALAAAVAVGCSPSVTDSNPGGTPTPTPSSTPTPTGNHITTNTTWSGSYTMLPGDTIVDPGVTLTVSAGTAVTAPMNGSLKVAGTLDVAPTAMMTSTSATPTTIFAPASGTWAGIDVLSGGVATIRATTLRSASTGLKTEAGASTTKLWLTTFDAVTAPFNVAGGSPKVCRARFINSSGTLLQTGGTLTILDSDLYSGITSNAQDVTSLTGGTFVLDHIRNGNTLGNGSNHCLIHATTTTINVSYSEFDYGAFFFMLSGSTATVSNSNLLQQEASGGLSSCSGTTVTADSDYWGTPGAPNPAPGGWTITNPTNPNPVPGTGPRPIGTTGACEATF